MNCYNALAANYDALTGDVEYEKRAVYLDAAFIQQRLK